MKQDHSSPQCTEVLTVRHREILEAPAGPSVAPYPFLTLVRIGRLAQTAAPCTTPGGIGRQFLPAVLSAPCNHAGVVDWQSARTPCPAWPSTWMGLQPCSPRLAGSLRFAPPPAPPCRQQGLEQGGASGGGAVGAPPGPRRRGELSRLLAPWLFARTDFLCSPRDSAATALFQGPANARDPQTPDDATGRQWAAAGALQVRGTPAPRRAVQRSPATDRCGRRARRAAPAPVRGACRCQWARASASDRPGTGPRNRDS